jgi:hypothetical protein
MTHPPVNIIDEIAKLRDLWQKTTKKIIAVLETSRLTPTFPKDSDLFDKFTDFKNCDTSKNSKPIIVCLP